MDWIRRFNASGKIEYLIFNYLPFVKEGGWKPDGLERTE